MSRIVKLNSGLPVAAMRQALLDHPELWNANPGRTESEASPHYGLDDIWVRFAPPGYGADTPHRSVWYPAADSLPIADLVFPLMSLCEGEELGGILITRIPAGKTCKPHVDPGWHAKHYEKFAIQIEADPGQAFCFDGEQLVTEPGDLFWFNNAHSHWVTNPTEHDRITLIICIKTSVMDELK